jgi:OOP family OmpA-OmpF porin
MTGILARCSLQLVATAALLLPALPGPVFAAHVAGSKDPPGFKRFEGSEIIYYGTRSYDQYPMARGPGVAFQGFKTTENVERQITRIVYRVPVGHTALELLRNYEQMLGDAGFTQTFELAPCNDSAMGDGNFFSDAWWHKWDPNLRKPIGGIDPACYVTAKTTKDGQDINVAVYTAESHDLTKNANGWWPNKNTPVADGQVLVGFDVITAKAVQISMVEVKAADMADALATKGFVDIYGILFDVDKIDIKPDSAKTLDEVASLLKIDRSLKLEIAGHTDNTGSAEHNQKLSEGRAQAVVDELVKKYGIDAARLTAKGYGDTKPVAPNDNDANKAKNRRVELRKV